MSLLNVGANGMAAGTFGANVASQGASNVATEGYTRRIAMLTPLGPAPAGGNGARAVGYHRVVDAFVEKRLLGVRASAGEAAARAQALTTVDEVFGDSGLGVQLDAFQAAIAEVASRPGEYAPRVAALSTADGLARAFNEASARVSEARADANGKLADEVGTINERLIQIAQLGTEISKAEVDGREAGDLRDRRDQFVREVASQITITTIAQDDGQLTVLLGGRTELVSRDGQAHLLTASLAPSSGDMRVTAIQAGAPVDVTSYAEGGTIAGLVAARDGAITTAAQRLDQLAFDVATAYNAVQSTGFDLDGGTGNDLFDVPATSAGAAGNITLSASIAGQPRRLAAATDVTSLPGDNRNALALQALASTAIASGGTRTASDAFSDAGAEVGTLVRTAIRDRAYTDDAKVQIEALRSSISGVTLDEEMMNLTRYQRAYQGSLEVVRVADEMLSSLLALRR